MATTYQVKKKAIGGYSVTYDCPHCSTPLTSALNEAGTSQPCPTCTKPFVVPGKAELDQLRGKLQLEQREKEQRQLQQQTEKEQQDKERARQRQLVDEEARQQRARESAAEAARRKHQDLHCPYCWEEIQPGVKKCKHCHELLDPALRAQAVKQEVVRFRPPLDDVFWLVVKFWAASLLFALIGWLIVMAFIAAVATS